MLEEKQTTSEPLNEDLGLPERYAVMQAWLDAATAVANQSGLSKAKQLVEFLYERAALGVPVAEGTRVFPSTQPEFNPDGDNYYVFLTPVLETDIMRLQTDDDRRQFVWASADEPGKLARYHENSHVIYLTSFGLSTTARGVVALHEAMHAQLDLSGQLDRSVEDTDLVEEKDIYLFEFELLKSLGGQAYLEILNKISAGIRISDDDPNRLVQGYQITDDDRRLLAQALGLENKFEANLWLDICIWNAYWHYFQKHLPNPEQEFVSFLKPRHAPDRTI